MGSSYTPHRDCWQFKESTSCADARSSHLTWSTTVICQGEYNFFLELERCDNCVGLSLRDLTHPDWFSINCSLPLLVNLLCILPMNSTTTFNLADHLTKNATAQFCSEANVLFSTSCFLFKWKMCAQLETENCFHDIQLYEVLFGAVATDTFPPVLINSSTVTITKYFSTFSHSNKTKSTHGAVCALKHEMKKTQKSENFFQCGDGIVISAQFVCDGTFDCSEGDDDKPCKCTLRDKRIKTCSSFTDSSKAKMCSPLYNQTLESHCKVFNFSELSATVTPETKKTQAKFMCKESGLLINAELVDDLIMDCYPNREDETKLETLLMGFEQYSCTDQTHLPCSEGHSKCFPLFEICLYNFDALGHLKPCRNGAHLYECSEFYCNAMLKCPGFYCIPWYLVCDGKWDCPSGHDELTADYCGKNIYCGNLFRCKGSVTCIHPNNVCDSHYDCPDKDDEQLCSLKHTVCLSKCTCLTFAIYCQNRTIDSAQKYFSVFRVLYMFRCQLATHFVFHDIFSFVVTKSNLEDVCSQFMKPTSVEHIYVGENQIKGLTRMCFHDTNLLKVLDIRQNFVSEIQKGIFQTNVLLKSLNLSGNPLTEVLPGTLTPLTNLKKLSLLDLTVKITNQNILAGMKLTLLEVDCHELCCLVDCASVCSQTAPWYFSCADLLLTKVTRGAFIAVSLIIILLNILSISLQRVSFKKGLEKIGAYGSTVASINSTDLTYSVLLIIFWGADLKFQGNFGVISSEWRTSSGCYIIFGLFIFFHTNAPLLLSFFALSRLMLVKYPLETRLKETKFVVKSISFVSVFCLLLSVVLTLCSWLLDILDINGERTAAICSPFVDPTHTRIIIYVISSVTIFLQNLTLVAIIVLQVMLFVSLKRQQEKLKGSISKETSRTPMVIQFVVFSTSNFVCWLPSGILHILFMILKEYPFQVVFWFIATVNSINSITLPLVFVVITIRKIHNG